jgi:eukaryotic-like serine/threonine-protein kinase
MSMPLSVENFIAVLRKSGLVESDRLLRALNESAPPATGWETAEQISGHLIALNLITKWQAEKLLQGKHRGYFLGKYKLLSLLGKGGMSSVYLAEHLLMRRHCALKVLPAKRVDDSSYLERFHREAQAAASLDHPNIVRAYDVDHQDEGNRQIHFLVMEYVEGESLQDLVPENGLASILDAAEFARQAALGLQHAHENGMVHRDIKPGNLLVDRNGVVKILDLGLARFFRVDEGNQALTLRHDERVLGTADYLAPEQAIDSHRVDSRADLYSLGCTLYFMVTGKPPFNEGSLAHRLLAHQVKTPPAVESLRVDLPLSLAAIIRKMMEKKPADRFENAATIENALFHWIDENADPAWRKAHSGVYGSRSNDSSTSRPDPPIAQPIPVAKVVADTLSDRTTPLPATKTSDGISKSISNYVKPKAVEDSRSETGLDAADTALYHARVVAPQTTTEPEPDITAIQSSAKSKTLDVVSTSQEPVGKSNQVSVPANSPEIGIAWTANNASELNFPVFETSPVSMPTRVRPRTSSQPTAKSSPRSISRFAQSKIRMIKSVLGIFAAGVLLLMIMSPFWGGSSGKKNEPAKSTPLLPFPKNKREITVGKVSAEYQSIQQALVAARDRYRPGLNSKDQLVIKVAEGTYNERIQIDGHTREWPEGITLRGEGKVHLSATGHEPVVQLANVSRFTIENIQVEANEKKVAIELTGDLHESRLTEIVISEFSDSGIVCKGTQGLSFGNSQVILEKLWFEPASPQAVGIRLEEGATNDVNNIVIRACRFLDPINSGIVIRGKIPYGIEISESVFNACHDGIRFEGNLTLKSIRVINNSFRDIKAGIRFLSLPNELSAELVFRRNLFVKTAVAETVVQRDYDESKFRSMLATSPPGIEANWSDRVRTAEPVGGEVQFLFEQGGRQGVSDLAFESTDPHSPGFLVPTETSPQKEVPGAQDSERKWVGAIGR